MYYPLFLSLSLCPPPPSLSRSLPTGKVQAFPSSPSQAKALMLFNLSSVFSIKKEYDKARRALQQVSFQIMHC